MTTPQVFVELARLISETEPEGLPVIVGRLVELEERARLRLRVAQVGNGNGGSAPGPEADRFLTYQEAASFLKCSPSYVETLVRQGKIPALRLPAADKAGRARDGRLVRIRVSDLRAWAEEHRA